MTELGLNCLPVGVTSLGKNVYPVSTTSAEPDAAEVIPENFEGESYVVSVWYRSILKKKTLFPRRQLAKTLLISGGKGCTL